VSARNDHSLPGAIGVAAWVAVSGRLLSGSKLKIGGVAYPGGPPVEPLVLELFGVLGDLYVVERHDDVLVAVRLQVSDEEPEMRPSASGGTGASIP